MSSGNCCYVAVEFQPHPDVQVPITFHKIPMAGSIPCMHSTNSKSSSGRDSDIDHFPVISSRNWLSTITHTMCQGNFETRLNGEEVVALRSIVGLIGDGVGGFDWKPMMVRLVITLFFCTFCAHLHLSTPSTYCCNAGVI